MLARMGGGSAGGRVGVQDIIKGAVVVERETNVESARGGGGVGDYGINATGASGRGGDAGGRAKDHLHVVGCVRRGDKVDVLGNCAYLGRYVIDKLKGVGGGVADVGATVAPLEVVAACNVMSAV